MQPGHPLTRQQPRELQEEETAIAGNDVDAFPPVRTELERPHGRAGVALAGR